MINKVKKNIKCLDTSINAAYDCSTSHPSVLFSTSAATAKHAAVIIAQTYASQVKAAIEACAFFW